MTTFAVPLSSSRLRKVTPLAVLGFCLIINIPAIDIIDFSGKFLSSEILIILGIFTLSVLRSSNVNLLPGWGVGAGYGAAILVMVNGVGGAFGLIPDAANLIVLVLGGVILYPATVWALGVSFQNSGSE